MDLAIEGEPIEPSNHAPSSRTGLKLQPKKQEDDEGKDDDGDHETDDGYSE